MWPGYFQDQKNYEKVKQDRQFTILFLSCDFPQVSRNVTYDIVREHLKYQKIYSRFTETNV